MVAFTMMALGLNIVVGYAGLLDLGYVAFYAVGAYTAGWFASQQFDQVTFHFFSSVPSDQPGNPHLDVARSRPGRLPDALRRHPDRPADAPPARRLPRDRDARLRRDHPAGRPQRRQLLRLRPDARDVRHRADRRGRLPRARELHGLPKNFQTSPNRAMWFYLGAFALLLITVFCMRPSAATRASAARGSRSARTRRPPRRWACRSCARRRGRTRSARSSAASPARTTRASSGGAFPADFYFKFSVFLLCMVILGGMGSVWGVIAGAMILGVPQHRGPRDDRLEDPGRRPRLRPDEVPVRDLRSHHRRDDAACARRG